MRQLRLGNPRALAVRRGWRHHLHHDQRTSEGEQLAAKIHIFQRDLRQYVAADTDMALAGPLLPYALHFGMASHANSPLVRLARQWVASFSALPGWHPPMPTAPNPLDEPVPLNNGWTGYPW